MSSQRFFISLNLPIEIARILAGLDPHLGGVRWLHSDQLHLTLAFLGPVEREKTALLREQLARIRFRAFFLELAGISTFPATGAPRIIWIGLRREHPQLFRLRKLVIDAALAAGLEPDLRSWEPHITLARCEKKANRAVEPFLRDHAGYSVGLVRFECFQLQSSRLSPHGSIYTIEQEVRASV